jgi:hypothetical protein
MSEFDYIVEETKLDGEIAATKHILENFVEMLRDHSPDPTASDLIFYCVTGYLQELQFIKDNP